MESETQRQRSVPFEFVGRAGEYFKIWMVNTLLTVLTVGLYSPWAKVRRRRYFYGSTLFLNAPFDYLADPIAILKGRLVAFVILVVYYLVGTFLPVAEPFLVILFVVLLPWIIIKAVAFSLANTAYRNIRFNFAGTYAKAAGIFIGLPILVALTAGLAYPLFNRERQKFLIENSAYGTTAFDAQASIGGFYRIYLTAAAVAVLLGVIAFSVVSLFGLRPPANPTDPQHQAAMGAFMLALMLVSAPLFMILYGYVYTATTNLVFNNTALDGHRFTSSLKVARICWLYLVNSVAIILSFGLLIPWAAVRMARYRVSCLALQPQGDLNRFLAAEGEQVRAIGEEIGDVFDIDIGL